MDMMEQMMAGFTDLLGADITRAVEAAILPLREQLDRIEHNLGVMYTQQAAVIAQIDAVKSSRAAKMFGL